MSTTLRVSLSTRFCHESIDIESVLLVGVISYSRSERFKRVKQLDVEKRIMSPIVNPFATGSRDYERGLKPIAETPATSAIYVSRAVLS